MFSPPLKFVAIAGIVAALMGSLHAKEFPAGSPAFVTNADTALQLAKQEQKPVIMIFSASWCPPCQSNLRSVYPSKEVTPFHDKFVWAYLDADDQANASLMQKYSVQGIPHFEFLDSEGESIGYGVGGASPQGFADGLGQILDRVAGAE